MIKYFKGVVVISSLETTALGDSLDYVLSNSFLLPH